MTYADELCALDLDELAIRFSDGSPRFAELDVHTWLAVMGRLADGLIEHAVEIDPRKWEFYSNAVESAWHAADRSGKIPPRETLLRGMNLTLALLHRVPQVSGVPLVDARMQAAGGLGEITVTPDEAESMSRGWQHRELREIAALRRIKEILKPALGLLEFIPPDDTTAKQLTRWREVYPLLP
ncbi:hypothetical protein ACIQUQ_34325 [Streptomyces sp. NPDC101118]|uniref:hypothetical protein n=1 Tax=Streptomyces sp. NPDC101118 TaxID=3366109 RepID=UPI003804FABC